MLLVSTDPNLITFRSPKGGEDAWSDERFKKLVASVARRGALESVPYCRLEDGKMFTAAGYHQLKAAKRVGLKEVSIMLDTRVSPFDGLAGVGLQDLREVIGDDRKILYEGRHPQFDTTRYPNIILKPAQQGWTDRFGNTWPSNHVEEIAWVLWNVGWGDRYPKQPKVFQAIMSPSDLPTTLTRDEITTVVGTMDHLNRLRGLHK